MVQGSVPFVRRENIVTETIATPKPVEDDNYLSPDDIFKTDDTVYKDVEVPEWPRNGKPGVITLRSFNAAEAAAFTDVDEKSKDKDLGPVNLVAQMAWNKKTNAPLFSKAQVAMLKTKSNKVFLRLQREGMALNGWRTPEERAAALEAAKNVSSGAL